MVCHYGKITWKETCHDGRIAALPNCRIAALPHCRIAALPHCRIAALPHCRIRMPWWYHTRADRKEALGESFELQVLLNYKFCLIRSERAYKDTHV